VTPVGGDPLRVVQHRTDLLDGLLAHTGLTDLELNAT
jgi:hypothetical protein